MTRGLPNNYRDIGRLLRKKISHLTKVTCYERAFSSRHLLSTVFLLHHHCLPHVNFITFLFGSLPRGVSENFPSIREGKSLDSPSSLTIRKFTGLWAWQVQRKTDVRTGLIWGSEKSRWTWSFSPSFCPEFRDAGFTLRLGIIWVQSGKQQQKNRYATF